MLERRSMIVLLAVLLLAGCSVKGMAMRSLADVLARPGETFGGDEDPELVGEALPFALKLMETVRGEAPGHAGIHLGLSAGFVQYAWGWLIQPADRLEQGDFARSQQLRLRARRLFLRAYGYALDGLELRRPGFRAAWRDEPDRALSMAGASEAAQLYWLGAALAMAVGTGMDDPGLLAMMGRVAPVFERCLTLDHGPDGAAADEALASWYAAIGELRGGGIEKARPHFERALTSNGGPRPGPLVAWAELAAVPAQDRELFTRLLHEALAIDPGRIPGQRLPTIIIQRRAAWLLEQSDRLFLD